MRRLQPKVKERREISIPAELRESLRDILETIHAAKHDPDINIDYGDALQTKDLCGGRYGKGPRPYVFTYYPTGDTKVGKWYLTLGETEIEDIVDGHLQSIRMYCCASPGCRTKFREADDSCLFCDYFDDPNYGTFSVSDGLKLLDARGVDGIHEDSSRDDIIRVLGSPHSAGGGNKDPSLGYIRPWISYDHGDIRIRFEFRKGRILTISIFESPKSDKTNHL